MKPYERGRVIPLQSRALGSGTEEVLGALYMRLDETCAAIENTEHKLMQARVHLNRLLIFGAAHTAGAGLAGAALGPRLWAGLVLAGMVLCVISMVGYGWTLRKSRSCAAQARLCRRSKIVLKHAMDMLGAHDAIAKAALVDAVGALGKHALD